MKILTISDKIEEQFLNVGRASPMLNGVELVLACGDLPGSYLEHLVTVLNVPLFYVLGNHDEALFNKPIAGCTCLDERIVQYKNRLFGGLSGSFKYCNNPLMVTEMEMHGKIAKMFPNLVFNRIRYRRYLDVLITHAPVRHIHDENTRVHKGFNALKMFDRQFGPAFHFHGHTMAGKRNQTTYHRTQIYNINHFKIVNI